MSVSSLITLGIVIIVVAILAEIAFGLSISAISLATYGISILSKRMKKILETNEREFQGEIKKTSHKRPKDKFWIED